MKGMDIACKVADAVLYEGYLLYPYRASAVKNQVRWQFGVFVPPGFDATGEPSACLTECLLEGGELLHARTRFLHVQERTADGTRPFDEASEREIDDVWPLTDLLEAEQVRDVVILGGRETDGAVTRTCHPLNIRVRASAERLPGPYGLVRLRLRLENTTTGDARHEALRRSLVAAHTLLAVIGGRFVSLLDPPEWARPAVDGCENLHTWPVLIDDEVMLSSPIILYDRPEIAPESPGDLIDSTEIDEILSLRTLALTDEEKREARATDPRAAEIIDRVDAMPPELLERLHGAIRSPGPRRGWDDGADEVPVFTTDKPWWDPGADASVSPETDSVTVAGTRVARGSKVRLRPVGRADAQDMFIAGRAATVEAVLFDVDGSQHLAVTIDDDPGTDLRRAQGRYWYFGPDDVEPL